MSCFRYVEMQIYGIHCDIVIPLNFVCACVAYGRMSCGCASEKYATKKNLYRYKRQIVGLICHIVFHFFGNFMPYPVFQDCFEMAARTSMKISTKIKEKNSGLIAGAPKKIHRQKQNISEKNIKK